MRIYTYMLHMYRYTYRNPAPVPGHGRNVPEHGADGPVEVVLTLQSLHGNTNNSGNNNDNKKKKNISINYNNIYRSNNNSGSKRVIVVIIIIGALMKIIIIIIIVVRVRGSASGRASEVQSSCFKGRSVRYAVE